MSTFDKAKIIAEEAAQIAEEAENHFRAAVRSKLKEIASTQAAIANLAAKLECQKKELRDLSFTAPDPIEL